MVMLVLAARDVVSRMAFSKSATPARGVGEARLLGVVAASAAVHQVPIENRFGGRRQVHHENGYASRRVCFYEPVAPAREPISRFAPVKVDGVIVGAPSRRAIFVALA